MNDNDPLSKAAHGRDVVVLDDSIEAAETLALALSLDGYSVRTVASGVDALSALADEVPSCLLMDFGLPDMDGLEVIRRVRALYGDALMVIMVTGWDLTQPRVSQASVLVDHHFTKPLSLEALRRLLPPLDV